MDEDEELADMTLSEFSERFPLASRELMLRFLPVLVSALNRQAASPAKFGIGFAIGAEFCQGFSMAEIAAKHGMSKAMISHEAREFCRKLGWPPSHLMRSETASESSRKARNNHCRKSLTKTKNEQRNTPNHSR